MFVRSTDAVYCIKDDRGVYTLHLAGMQNSYEVLNYLVEDLN